MAASPNDVARRYAPLILLAIVEVLVVALVPNNGTPTSLNTAQGQQYSTGGTTTGGTGTDGSGADGIASGPAGATTGPGGTATGSGATSTTPGATSAGPRSTGPNPAATNASGLNKWGYSSSDLSHCDKAGLQVMPTSYAPQCRPVWHGGDNGGATMTGASAKQINFVYYIPQGNAQVNAILNQEQLAATPDQFCHELQAFVKDVNKRFEFYGRTLVSLDGPGNHSGKAQEAADNTDNCQYPFFQGQCSLTPPDPPCERAEADLIAAQMKPAFVLVPSADPSFTYELARKHIIVYSGVYGPESYHDQLAPYFYEVSMNGTQAAKIDAEYYCKKLAGKPVKYAGVDVTGAANPPKRKLAVIYPENQGDVTAKLSAQEIANDVKGCGGGDVLLLSYASDINTAQQQSSTIVASLKKNGITTVSCWCDPIAPVFTTNTMDSNNYHPEIFSVGIGLLDYDALAQLYNPNVWRFAFGVSLLGNTVPFAQSNAVKAYHDAGFSGQPDKTANLSWTFVQIMANAIQDAGPHITPTSIHQGLVAAPPMGGDAVDFKVGYYGAYQWSSQKDVREVWYCPTQNSSLNNKPGTYVPVNGGKRYELGGWDTSLAVFPNGPCA